jgi:AcrR family transcriptional regulator
MSSHWLCMSLIGSERHGYAAGTTNHIAERAGVSIGRL